MAFPHNDEKTDERQLIREAARSLRESEELLTNASRLISESQRKRWKSLAGDLLESMMQDAKATESYLYHSDRKLRLAAVILLQDYWTPTAEFAETCKSIVGMESDAKVREAAVAAIGRFYAETNDPEIAQMFANLVHDNAAPTEVRITAYNGLFLLRGLPPTSWPVLAATFDKTFHFPEDVDWSFVESFR